MAASRVAVEIVVAAAVVLAVHAVIAVVVCLAVVVAVGVVVLAVALALAVRAARVGSKLLSSFPSCSSIIFSLTTASDFAYHHLIRIYIHE